VFFAVAVGAVVAFAADSEATREERLGPASAAVVAAEVVITRSPNPATREWRGAGRWNLMMRSMLGGEAVLICGLGRDDDRGCRRVWKCVNRRGQS
jgi:hypothetical protein